ncbi:MAG TPA: TonB-dependent receptor plug domain-containing protein [Gemmatimonadales bacterium]|nr:TonB-dependent receptor plug domain-containing protein [Gemmatimonadales bacterium]
MGASLGHRLAVAVLASLALAACHPAKPSPQADADRIVITEEMISRSGGQNAWEVLRREAPQITFSENRNGQATAMSRRGRSSFVLNDSPMVIIDGARNQDIRALQSLPATTLMSIEILTGIEGTTYYGTDAVGGVIVIKTKTGGQ